MIKIDNARQAAIAADIRKALSDVAEKWGLEKPVVDLRRSTSGSFVRLMKLDMAVVDPNAKAPVAEATGFGEGVSRELAQALARIGVTKVTNAKGERIVEYKPNRRSYPFVFQGPKGGRWKGSVEEIRARFG